MKVILRTAPEGVGQCLDTSGLLSGLKCVTWNDVLDSSARTLRWPFPRGSACLLANSEHKPPTAAWCAALRVWLFLASSIFVHRRIVLIAFEHTSFYWTHLCSNIENARCILRALHFLLHALMTDINDDGNENRTTTAFTRSTEVAAIAKQHQQQQQQQTAGDQQQQGQKSGEQQVKGCKIARDLDILLGRGRSYHKRPGNRRFRGTYCVSSLRLLCSLLFWKLRTALGVVVLQHQHTPCCVCAMERE